MKNNLGATVFHSQALDRLGAFLILLTASLLAAPYMGRHLSHQATAIGRRVMGMILAAIAIEMIVSSLRILFPGWTGY